MADFLDFLFELACFLLGLLLEGVDLVVCLVSVFVGIVCLLDDISHFLSLLVQLVLQFFVQIIEDNSLLPQAVDHQFEFLVDRDGLIELLVGLVQSILQDLYLLLEVVLALCSRIAPQTVLFLLDDLLLKVGDMDVNIFLGFLLFLDGVSNLI